MPKRTGIREILIIGSGPIVMGQAWEFDYSGTRKGGMVPGVIAFRPIREESGRN